MAYMHTKTFALYSVPPAAVQYDCVFIDDLIALPVQMLNQKGYYTTFCCSGHPPEKECSEYRTDSYIAFREGVIALPALPDGFYTSVSGWNSLSLRRDYVFENTDKSRITAELCAAMKQLHAWTLSIPPYREFLKEHLRQRREQK